MKTALKPKTFYLKRILAHEAADEVIRGTGWENGKGCSIGCTLNNYNHAAYEKAGIGPEWLARVQDTLFEGMSAEKSKTWTSVITKAIPDRLHGKTDAPEWDKIKAKFLIMVLKSTLDTFDHAKYPDVKKAVDMSIKLWKRKDIGSEAFKAYAANAANAARCAAYAARYAAYAAYAANAANAARYAANAAIYAARYAADAAYAAYAAIYAAYAANAANAARYAANAAIYAAHAAIYDYFADGLIKILRSVK